WGMVLLLSAYLILYTINPNLVSFRNPTMEAVNISALQSNNTTTGGNSTTGGTTGGTNSSSDTCASYLYNPPCAGEDVSTECIEGGKTKSKCMPTIAHCKTYCPEIGLFDISGNFDNATTSKKSIKLENYVNAPRCCDCLDGYKTANSSTECVSQ
ncbi:MAG: hypothetical protein PHP03_02080, partial [Candidatus Pacebacteria bacterium]|nr:hypothetical protein [Candidatus Paceibacterota bacterium]